MPSHEQSEYVGTALPMLSFLPHYPNGMHESRAWLVTSILVDVARCTPVTSGEVPDWVSAQTCFGAIVFNSNNDLSIIRQLRGLGIRTLYYPSFGPVVDGHFVDNTLYEWNHRLLTRLRIQAAHATLVDSMIQANIAQAHYDVVTPWIVSSGGGATTYNPRLKDTSRSLWVIPPCHKYKTHLSSWAAANDYIYREATVGEAYLNANKIHDIVFCVDRFQLWHPDKLISWLEVGIPMVVPECGLFAQLPECMCEFDFDAPPSEIGGVLDRASMVSRKETVFGWQTFVSSLLHFFYQE